MKIRTFDLLAPHVLVQAVESAYGMQLDGTLTAYPSYINRVYEVRDTEGASYIAKFYRPGRWIAAAIEEEHRFVLECAQEEIPVVAPLQSVRGATLTSVVVEEEGLREEFLFTLYSKRGGRNFDGETDEDWIRLGALVGRVHGVARLGEATDRLICAPSESAREFVREIEEAGVVHADQGSEFFDLVQRGLDGITPLWDQVPLQRVHGDCHRGNILDRSGEGLLLMDFDDMMMGPAVQDLWLLLPGSAHACRREMNLILEGYTEFCDLDHATLRLVEPLRLMRMIYYLAWSARQREDRLFQQAYPGWGGEAFWIKEIEDVRTQLDVIRDELAG